MFFSLEKWFLRNEFCWKVKKLKKVVSQQLVWVQFWLVAIHFYALHDIQGGIHYWHGSMNLLKRSKDPCPSNNGRWANTTSWTCDQSESRTVGNSSCCWNIYPTRKLEIKGLFWFVVRICQSELILENWHFSNSDIGWRKIKYTYCSIVTKLGRYSARRTRTWRNTKIARRSS